MDARELTHLLAGAKLELISEVGIENLNFSEDGWVSCTTGAKDGPVCAPLLKYTVTADGRLQMTQSGREWQTWHGVELRDGVLTVETGTHVKRYLFTPAASSERRLP